MQLPPALTILFQGVLGEVEYLKRRSLTSLPLVAPALRVFRIVRVVRGLRLVKVVGSLNRGRRALGASIEADLQLNDRMLSRCSRLFGTGAEDSRGMLSTIADSMITIAGVTFSITIVARARLQPI